MIILSSAKDAFKHWASALQNYCPSKIAHAVYSRRRTHTCTQRIEYYSYRHSESSGHDSLGKNCIYTYHPTGTALWSVLCIALLKAHFSLITISALSHICLSHWFCLSQTTSLKCLTSFRSDSCYYLQSREPPIIAIHQEGYEFETGTNFKYHLM